MKKWKATVLLTIVLVLTAILTFLAFASFSVGVKDFNGFLGAIHTDYDLSGGRAYTLTLAQDNEEEVENVSEVIETLKGRLSLLGYNDYKVVATKNVDDDVKDYDIRIEIKAGYNEYGEEDLTALNSDIAVAAAYGEVVFYGGTSANPTEKILTDGDPVADAAYLGAASDGSSTYHQVSITFTDYGYNEIMKLLKDNSEYYVQINLGETVLLSGSSALNANYFNGKSLAITSPSETSAKQFALQIKTGGLAYKYEVGAGVKVVSPYGEETVKKCVIAMAELVLLIVIVMFIINKGYGLTHLFTAILSLDVFLFLLIAVPGIKMNIGGVIGFALAWILAAAGYILTSLRIKEEVAHGKTLKSAVKTAYNKTIAPLVGGYLAVIAAALILLAFASGAVYNFAIVLAIGTVVAAASALLFARMFGALLLPIAGYKERFLGLKRAESAEDDVTEGK